MQRSVRAASRADPQSSALFGAVVCTGADPDTCLALLPLPQSFANASLATCAEDGQDWTDLYGDTGSTAYLGWILALFALWLLWLLYALVCGTTTIRQPRLKDAKYLVIVAFLASLCSLLRALYLGLLMLEHVLFFQEGERKSILCMEFAYLDTSAYADYWNATIIFLRALFYPALLILGELIY
jgi:hypothetical protein